MRRSDARILTTHVGSLIRPAELLQLGAAARENPDNEPRYADALQRAIADVVAHQAAAGIDIVMWAKLQALAEGARIASRELWG